VGDFSGLPETLLGQHLRSDGKLMGRSDPISDLLRWLQGAPPGTAIPAAAIAEILAALPSTASREPPPEPLPLTWREKVWLVPAETRLGVREAAQAIGRPVSWIYRRTGEKSAKAPLPHRKLDGELVFVAGELRAWMEGHEAVIVPALWKAG
jgi:predicted DNA-binding transcriptional regulator AlpA